jgi:tetratricopeptide (TPR) repeat protein
MSTKNFKDAPFFFALALRFDPLNVEAVINTAKCIAETESIERGISMIQDELNQREGARAELLTGIAELQIQKGDWDAAQKTVNEALQSNPEFPLSYRLQGQIHMSHEATDKEALNKALEAYKAYSDRNPSDPSGYLERYKILARKGQYEQAYEELKRIYEIYPKYPQLHFYLGALFAVQGNHKAAIEEFQKELVNNPNHLQTVMAYGRELLEMGAAQEALNQFNKAMRIAPGSSEAKHYAGWASRAMKNYDAGAALIRSAIALDPGNPLLYKRLGIVYRESGNLGQACSAFKKYLEMEPDAADKDEFRGCR